LLKILLFTTGLGAPSPSDGRQGSPFRGVGFTCRQSGNRLKVSPLQPSPPFGAGDDGDTPGSPIFSQLFCCVQRCLGYPRLRNCYLWPPWGPETSDCPLSIPWLFGFNGFPQPDTNSGPRGNRASVLPRLPAKSAGTLAGFGFSPTPFILPCPVHYRMGPPTLLKVFNPEMFLSKGKIWTKIWNRNWRKGHQGTVSPGDLSCVQTPNPDTVVISQRCLMTGTWCGYSLEGTASTEQIWIFIADIQTELRDPCGGTGEGLEKQRGFEPHRKNNVGWPRCLVLPSTIPSTNECTGRDLWLQLYSRRCPCLTSVRGESLGPAGLMPQVSRML
jgi:hypothetical protein